MIVPTARLLMVALAGLPVIVLTGSHDLALLIACLWLLGCALLALIDARFTPSSDTLTWSRKHDTKLSLGAWNAVTLQVSSTENRAVRLQLRDSMSAWLGPDGVSAEGTCPARGIWEHHYRLLPLRRGDYVLGPIAARFLGPLGLAWRQRTVPLIDDARVYPNLKAVRTYEALMRRGQLPEMGLHNSRRWGEGTEFERLRAYLPDDEYRRVNWKATARRGEPMVVDYQTERSQNVVLVLDAGRLMSTRIPLEMEGAEAASAITPGRALTRLDFAVNASLLLAFVSQQRGDRAGLLAFSDRPLRYLAPRAGHAHFLAICDGLYNLQAEGTEADFGQGLGYLAVRNPRRSLLVLFTDISESDGAKALVTQVVRLSRRHLVLVVTLRDPGLAALAGLRLDSADAAYKRAVAQGMLVQREEILRALRNAGILTLDVSAQKLSPSLVNRYLEIKARNAL